MATPLQELEIRAADIRKRLGEIGDIPDADWTDAITTELSGLRSEHGRNEQRQSAMKLAGDGAPTPIETNTSEGREFRGLLRGGNVGMILDAAVNGRPVTGQTAELQKHYGLDVRSVPLSMLITDWNQPELETRAVTAAPAEVGQQQQSIIPYVFPQSAAAFLGVDMPTVGVGEAVYTVLTKELDVRTPAENATAAETTGAFSAEVLSPSRIQAAFFYSREDRARFAGMDAALRENLSMGLSDGLDQQILAGTNGLLSGTVLPNHNVTATTTYDNYIGHFAFGRVDGRYASTTADLRVVMGNAAYNHAGQTYRTTTIDRTALDRLMDLVSGVRVSAHVPAEASKRQNNVVRRGMAMDMVAPIWEGIEILPDEITLAATGQIKITAIMLHAIKVLRQDGFYKQQIQVP